MKNKTNRLLREKHAKRAQLFCRETMAGVSLNHAARLTEKVCECLRESIAGYSVDNPHCIDRLAEAQLLSMLADAVKLRDALKGVVK
jgi:hypothetical protein